MPTDLDPVFVEALTEAPDYRTFLARFFKPAAGTTPEARKLLSYSDFSRRAGFKSRAYIRDIVGGQKRVLPANFERICQGLGLSNGLREYLRWLVAREEPALREALRATPLQVEARLGDLRRRLRRTIATERRVLTRDGSATRVLAVDVPAVFAASGAVEVGATLPEIAGRTRLSAVRITRSLRLLEEIGALTRAGDRYRPSTDHLTLEKLGALSSFHQDFERALATCRARMPRQMERPGSLFFTSTVCVKDRDLPRIKEELRAALLSIVGVAEDPNGDCVADLVIGFTSNTS